MSCGGEGEAAEGTLSHHGGHLKDSAFNQLEVVVFLAARVPTAIIFLWGNLSFGTSNMLQS